MMRFSQDFLTNSDGCFLSNKEKKFWLQCACWLRFGLVEIFNIFEQVIGLV